MVSDMSTCTPPYNLEDAEGGGGDDPSVPPTTPRPTDQPSHTVGFNDDTSSENSDGSGRGALGGGFHGKGGSASLTLALEPLGFKF